MTPARALQAALEVEHQVIYGYGIVGAHLGGRLRDDALARLAVHRNRRDRITELLRGMHAEAPPGAAAYRDPVGVVDRASALTLVEVLEDSAAGAAWDLVAAGRAGDAVRRLGVATLEDAAIWAVNWRLAYGDQVEPPLPGDPRWSRRASSQPSSSGTSSPSASTTPSGSTS